MKIVERVLPVLAALIVLAVCAHHHQLPGFDVHPRATGAGDVVTPASAASL